MVTWGDVKRWEPAPLQDAVGAINAEYNKLVPASEDLRKLTTPYGWTGEAANAAANRVTRIVDRLEAWAAELEAARTAATNVGDAIAGVRRGADEAVHLASSQNFGISDEGAVTDNGPVPPPPPEQAESVAAERRTMLAELADRVRQVLLSADDVDNDFCAVLDRLLDHTVHDPTTNDNSATSLAAAGALGIQAGGLTIPPPPPEGATAAQNAAYWATLSDQQRKQLAMDHPRLVGPRDGFTAEHRDIANRRIFGDERDALQLQRDELRHRLDGLTESDPREMNEYHEVEDQMAALDEKLDGMAQIEQRLNDPDKPPAYLLGIDGDHAGRAIVASGNPDTSANVATFVPGTTAGLPDIGGNLDRADQMSLAAESAGSESTSVVTWIGYDAPQQILPDAADTTFADNAEHALHSFQDGLQESHQRPEPPHTTVVGHSYGSTAVGQTARDHGIAADNLIFAGSPGVGVDHADQLRLDGVPADQVGSRIYATASPTDPIPYGTNFRTPELDGIDPLGPDPTTQWFGGRTFDSERTNPFSAHGDYWEPNSPSLRKMGQVIAGG